MHDYYQILGVNRAESLDAIHTAYRRLAKQCHPDLAGVQSKEKFQGIQEAYEVLSDPDRRRDYDAAIDKRTWMRGKSRIEPEPLVPSRNPSWNGYPEPLIRESSPIEEIFSPPSSDCSFCKGFNSSVRELCPFCRAYEPTKDDVLQFLMRSFGFPRRFW